MSHDISHNMAKSKIHTISHDISKNVISHEISKNKISHDISKKWVSPKFMRYRMTCQRGWSLNATNLTFVVYLNSQKYNA